MRVGIVGAGSVGSTIAYSITTAGLASHIVLTDQNVDKAAGEAMDLLHCAAFIPPVDITGGDLSACRGMDVVVVTAGSKRRPGELRTDLVRRNIAMCREIAPPLAAANPDAVFVVVSNPVDLLTLFFLEHSALPPSRIMGSGTLLDTSRLRHLLSRHFAVDPRSVHAYIIGEHGEGSVPYWSDARIGGLTVEEFADAAGVRLDREKKNELFRAVLTAGQEVIQRKGATFYGVAQTVVRILTAVARNEGSILTVSVELDGFLGLHDMALSLPVIVDRSGVRRTLHPSLDEEEAASFLKGAAALAETARDVEL